MWFYPSLSWLQNFWLYMAYSIKSKISTRRPIHLPNFFIHYSHIKLHYKKLAGRDGNADWILTLSLTIILQADKTDSIQPWQRKRAYSPYNTAKLACSSPTCTSTPLHLCFTHYKASHLSVLLLLWILSSFLNWNSCLNIENLLYSYDLFISTEWNIILVYQKYLNSSKDQFTWISYFMLKNELGHFPYRGQQLFYLLVVLKTISEHFVISILRIPWKWIQSEHIFPVGIFVMRTNIQYK